MDYRWLFDPPTPGRGPNRLFVALAAIAGLLLAIVALVLGLYLLQRKPAPGTIQAPPIRSDAPREPQPLPPPR
jgi:hypothetical protein